MAGKTTSELWQGERHFSVVVRLAASLRTLDALPKLLIGAPSGAQVPQISQTSGAMNIARENG